MQKILYIDDDIFQLELVTDMLRDTYEVITARSGKEAMEYLIWGTIPLAILLDIIMPEMDGWETYNKIRGISLLRDVPILFITAFPELEAQQRAFTAGASGFIEKPLVKADLIRRIEMALRSSYARLLGSQFYSYDEQ